MPRLRSLPAGFTLRNRGFRSPEKSLAESSASGKLLAEYELACRAGKHISRFFHIIIAVNGSHSDYAEYKKDCKSCCPAEK